MAVRATFGSSGQARSAPGNEQIVVLIPGAASRQFSRREFLKFTAIGVAALVLVSPRRGIAESAVASRSDEFRAWGQDNFALAALTGPYQELADWPAELSWQLRSNTADQKGTP